MNRAIGFFDSGVGGLTVLKKIKKILPNETCLYFGDTKNMPYGEKTEEQLIQYADAIFKFFEKQNVKAVVMACNTTSAITYEKLKDKYNFKIYPIIQTVSEKLAQEQIGKLGIIATPATVNSHAYSREIKKYNSKKVVVEIPAPNWVRIVEEHRINDELSLAQVKEVLDDLQLKTCEKIVLACTHYPYLSDVIKNFMPIEKFIDPADLFAESIKKDLEANGLLSNSKQDNDKFFVSSNPENFVCAAATFYQLNDIPTLVTLN